jgi:hypothetical protein
MAVRGVPGGIRTSDLLYRKQTLYPAELRVHASVATIVALNY